MAKWHGERRNNIGSEMKWQQRKRWPGENENNGGAISIESVVA
jgi:hypothetical protein